MSVCGAIVAFVAVPVGLFAWRLGRRPTPCAVMPWHAPWGPFEVVFAFLVLNLLVPVLAFQSLLVCGAFVIGPDEPPVAATVRMLWASLLAFPLQLLVVVVVQRALYPTWRWLEPVACWPPRVALAVLVWLAITPVVLGINLGVNAAFAAQGWAPREHPLVKLASQPVVEQVLFVFQACVAAPVVEELVFRGILLPWLLASSGRSAATLVVAALVSASSVSDGFSPTRGPVVFGVAMLLALPLTQRDTERARTTSAVFASSCLFAAVHATVWPSPIPLLLLGVGLGLLAIRTRSILVPVLVHGLFNAVSAVYVLRGPA
jgi:membrane protease YdiL (CAAX protease family)